MVSGVTKSRKLMLAAFAAAVLGTGIAAAPSDAEARWRGRGGGAAVAAGIIGGLAAGALIASSARPAYAYPAYDPYYAPGPAYGPVCHLERRRVWINPYEYTVRRVEVCD